MNALAELRELTRAELTAADEHLTRWLTGDTGSLVRTYPQVFCDDGSTTSLGVFDDDGRLRSHAAVRRVRLIASTGDVAASLVGVVATDPAARGEQHASRLMHAIADRELGAGRDLLLLWSDRWEFYAKLGYAIAGVQAEAQLRRDPAATEAGACRRATRADLPALVALHGQKPWRVDRDASQTELLVFGSDTDCLVQERQGRITAYACHRKGLDFDGWWHEFGGSDAEVGALLPAALAALGQQRATALIPPYRNDLLASLASRAESVAEGIVALGKPLTAAGACELFIDGLDSI